jgi:outer membrane protein
MPRLFRYVFLALSLSSLFTCEIVKAQRELTLDECLKIAYDQAPTLMQAKRNYDIASANAEAASRSLRSRVDLNISAPIYTDNTTPIYNPVTGTTDLLRQHESLFGGGLTISQPIFWTGGSISFTGNVYHRSQFGSSNTSQNDFLGLGSFEINQPIFKANELRMTERLAEIDRDLAMWAFIAAKAAITFRVKSQFYALYQSQEELKIQQDEITKSQANVELADNKFKAGLIAEVDALQLEVDLANAETDLFDKQRRLLGSKRDLLTTIGIPMSGAVVAHLDSMREVAFTIDPELAVRKAIANREEVMSAQYAIEREEIAVARLANTRSVNASLVGTFGATQNAGTVPLLFENPYVNRGVSFNIMVPLFDGGAQSFRMHAAESSVELSRLTLHVKQQQIEQEVRSTIEQLEAAKKQVEVAKKSVAVAIKAYDLSHARFDAGKITSQDLSLAQGRLTRAKLSSLNAEVAEQLALADITQKTLYDFENGRKLGI